MDEEHHPVMANIVCACGHQPSAAPHSLDARAVLLRHESMTRVSRTPPEKIARFARGSRIMIERWGLKPPRPAQSC